MQHKQKEISERIKIARTMAGFSKPNSFCRKFSIPHATLNSWESGINSLTPTDAKCIVDALKTAEIHCTEEWLLEGEGYSPRPLKEADENLKNNSPQEFDALNQNISILHEIYTFTGRNKDGVVTLVTDDGMLPFYQIGDYIGGVYINSPNFNAAISKRCIIELSEGKILVRMVYPGSKDALYTLSALNPTTKASPVTVYDVEIKKIAPIIWHRTHS
jgi:transcriptional regulator with XRE-family HTH domain